MVQKIYGRQPENIEVINRLFHSILGKFSSEKVIRAFEIWLEKSQEFPTPADIVGIIKRNGKPPLSREIYIAISKKDGADRTKDDWQYLRDYEAEQNGEAWGLPDEQKESVTLQENIRLRQQLKKIQDDYREISALLSVERNKKTEIPIISQQDKIQRTIDAMRNNGAPEEDIQAFRESMAA